MCAVVSATPTDPSEATTASRLIANPAYGVLPLSKLTRALKRGLEPRRPGPAGSVTVSAVSDPVWLAAGTQRGGTSR